jgi:hypothetical protein
MHKKFRIDASNPGMVIASLVVGVVLAVGGSALATSVGSNISVTNNLTVSGNSGVGTSTPGTLLSVQGVGNWDPTNGSTLYTSFILPSFNATSTTASNGIGTTTPGSTLSIQGVANFVSGATSTIYTDLSFRSLSATSTIYSANGTAAVPSLSFLSDTDTGLFRGAANVLGFATAGTEQARIDASGNLGVGTSTPSSVLSVQGVANFVSAATSTFYTPVSATNFSATTTTATSTFRGGAIIATGGGSVGIGTTTPIKSLSVVGDVLIGGSATTTLSVTSSSATAGSCIQLRAASSSTMYRLYIGTPPGSLTAPPLVVEVGQCASQAWGQ